MLCIYLFTIIRHKEKSCTQEWIEFSNYSLLVGWNGWKVKLIDLINNQYRINASFSIMSAIQFIRPDISFQTKYNEDYPVSLNPPLDHFGGTII